MASCISRRNFLKASTAAGLVAAIQPVSAGPASAKKSRVVIATDTSCITNGKPDAEKVTALVDHAIMAFTGKTTKAAAYEAIFPAPVTTSTQIFMKMNEASGSGLVNKAVRDAFQKGLLSMMNGSFPAAKIDNPVLKAMVSCKPNTDAATYIINCPVAWMHSVQQYGVTLSQKNTMNYDGPPGNHHSANASWLHTVSLSAAIKPKQVLSLMDVIVGRARGGPGGSSDFTTGTIIVSNDIVAVDYQTLRIMEKQQGVSASQIATGDKNLKAAETAGLGTCTPSNMEVITISAPWPSVGTINDAQEIMLSRNIRVLPHHDRVDFAIPGNHSKQLAVFDMMGNQIWQAHDFSGESVTWNHATRQGIPVPPGMYIFRIISGTTALRGTIMVYR